MEKLQKKTNDVLQCVFGSLKRTCVCFLLKQQCARETQCVLYTHTHIFILNDQWAFKWLKEIEKAKSRANEPEKNHHFFVAVISHQKSHIFIAHILHILILSFSVVFFLFFAGLYACTHLRCEFYMYRRASVYFSFLHVFCCFCGEE